MAPRRAGRARAGQSARNLASVERSAAAQIKRDAQRAIARTIQEFAVSSMNELAEIGPAWSGEFSASWGFAPEGQTPQSITAGATGRIKKYTKNDVPVRRVEQYIKNGVSRFNIVNTSDHAAIAIDEEKAVFENPGFSPIKQQEFGAGRDQPSLRYDIGPSVDPSFATASRTADQDWFVTYVVGGGLQKGLNAAFAKEFKIEG